VDADGNIDWSSKTDESTGGGNTPAKTEPLTGGDVSSPSEGTMTPEQLAALKESAGWTFGVSPTIRSITPVVTTPSTPTKPGKTPSEVPSEVPATKSRPSVNPKPTTKTDTPIVTVVNPNQQSMQANQNQSKNANQNQNKNQNANRNENAKQNGNGTDDKTQSQLGTQTETSTSISPPTQTVTATQPPPSNTDTGMLPKNGQKPAPGAEELTAEDIANATTWKAGFGWWVRLQNGRYRFLKQLPPGAQPVKPGKGSGYASVQTIKGKPIVDTHRMGAVTVTINRPGKQPGARGAISYHAAGQGKPGLSMTRKGKMVNIRGVGLANINKIPRGRILKE
jgi:hypothetical protein